MAEGGSKTTQHEFVYIDLDDPSPWWASTVGVIAVALIVAVLIAPWMIDWEDGPADSVAANTIQMTSSVCQPNRAGLPAILDTPMASWNRFCEWFIQPGADNP